MQIEITDAIRNELRANGQHKKATDNMAVYRELDWINQTTVADDRIGYMTFNGDEVFFD